LLDRLGTNVPLLLVNNTPVRGSYDLRLTEGGTLVNLNSELLIGAPDTASESLTGWGKIFQDGGLIRIAYATLFSGEISVTNGLFEALGYFEFGGVFNQYGGTVDVNLTLQGTYHLFGGKLIGGVQIGQWYGGSFIQDGGTNLGSVRLDAYTTHPSL